MKRKMKLLLSGLAGAVALTLLAGCATTNGNNSYNPNGVWPVKGATLLMQRP